MNKLFGISFLLLLFSACNQSNDEHINHQPITENSDKKADIENIDVEKDVNKNAGVQQQVYNKQELDDLQQQALSATPSQCKMLKTKMNIIPIVDNDSKAHKIKFSIFKKDADLLLSDNQIIDIQRQMLVADTIYQDVLGLTHPLIKPRYVNATAINVRLRTFKNNSGMAYDEVTGSKALSNDCFINVGLDTLKVRAHTSITPAHEAFHLYQNSYFMFKQRWLTEGTARWSESLLRKGVGNTAKTLPQNTAELQAVMKQSYGASKMFARLFQLVDSTDSYQIPPAVFDKTYLNGTPIISDNKAYGTAFIKTLFIELEKQSFKASSDKGWQPYQWQEKDQKNAELNPYIWQAIKNAVNRTIEPSQQSQELQIFMKIQI